MSCTEPNAGTSRSRRAARTAKPTIEALGIDVAAQSWHRSGAGDGSVEVAFVRAGGGAGSAGAVGCADGGGAGGRGAGGGGAGGGGAGKAGEAAGADWVLIRVAGDSAGRVLVYDMNEWACFLDGARNGEFDDAAD